MLKNIFQNKKYIGMYFSWLECESDKFVVVGSSPTLPTRSSKSQRYL